MSSKASSKASSQSLHPRTLILSLGLILTASVFALEAHWLTQFAGLDVLNPDPGVAHKHPKPGMERLFKASKALSAAFDEHKCSRPSKMALNDKEQWLKSLHGPNPEALGKDYEAFVKECLDIQETDPENGLYSALAEIVRIESQFVPGQHYQHFEHYMRAEHSWQRLPIKDQAVIDQALTRLERALARPKLSTSMTEAMTQRLKDTKDMAHQSELLGLMKRATALFSTPIGDLMLLRGRVNVLHLLALQYQRDGRDANRVLSLARRLVLKLSHDSCSIIELMVARAIHEDTLRTWLVVAAMQQDPVLASAVREELMLLTKTVNETLRLDVDVSRLGTLDHLMMPAGGWSGLDPKLNRDMDYAHYESALFLALMGLLLLCLMHCAWVLKTVAEPSDIATPGWTFGDLLNVTLPSFGLAAVAALLFARLHPAREFGAVTGQGLPLLMTHALCVLIGGAWLFYLRLREQMLGKFGLTSANPELSSWALGLGLAMLYGCSSWLGVYSSESAFLLTALLALPVLGFSLYAWRLSHLDENLRAGLRRAQARAAISGLGVALILCSGLYLTVVRTQRQASVEAYGQQLLEKVSREADNWSDGLYKKRMRRLLEDAAVKPDLKTARDLSNWYSQDQRNSALRSG